MGVLACTQTGDFIATHPASHTKGEQRERERERARARERERKRDRSGAGSGGREGGSEKTFWGAFLRCVGECVNHHHLSNMCLVLVACGGLDVGAGGLGVCVVLLLHISVCVCVCVCVRERERERERERVCVSL